AVDAVRAGAGRGLLALAHHVPAVADLGALRRVVRDRPGRLFRLLLQALRAGRDRHVAVRRHRSPADRSPHRSPMNSDRPPHSAVAPLSGRRAARCHTRMTAGTTTRTGTTAEHELAELQREHGRPLFALLLRLSDGDRQRAEDLLQETFVRAW